MYYSHSCSYCTKVFYTFHTNKEGAARKLYEGIKRHLIEYAEDHKEYQFDEDPGIEADQMYAEMTETTSRPSGAYPV